MKPDKDISNWTHSHQFNPEKKVSETKTLIVIIVTIVAMVIEIIAGWYFGSMALFSDGWHMMTHATALSISFFAYVIARTLSADRRFGFGTWKIEILGAYTSAIVLGFVGFFIFGVSINRIYHPVDISYNQALVVTCFGLIVNVICVLVLKDNHHHTHEKHHHHKTKQDLNLKSAYLHVLADALTSVLAIIALLGAKYFEWIFLDPLWAL
ncbi:MAG: cation transporter [Clostridiales bacterium]|nr:cation transporter [Clostridiales bacterium]